MDQHIDNNPAEKDFSYNWVSSSRYLFYLHIVVFIAFTFGCGYSLHKRTYKGKPEVTIQSSTLYTPEYK